MLILKIYYHIMTVIKKIFFKLIYGKHIKFGRGTTFRKGFSLMIDKNAYVTIGNNCFFNNYCSINAMEIINIGDDCLFGENVKIYDHNHVFKYKNVIRSQGFKTSKIKIGKNCWIGSNSVILKNSSIGDNVIIGAGNIVNSEIQSNVVVNKNEVTNIKFVENE